MRDPTRHAVCVAALALAGCAPTMPTLDRPAAPVAATFPGATPDAAGPAASDLEWSRFHADARLQRLIELALQSNRDLRLATLAIEQAQAQWRLRGADEWPTLGVGAAASRVPKSGGGGTNSFSAGLQLSTWEIDFFGRLRSLSDVAQAQLLATEEARRAAQVSLVASVATAHFALLADDALIDLTRRTIATREDSLRLTKLKFDVGAASELDFRLAESLLEGARATLSQLQRQRLQDENALVLLVGRPLPADLPAATSFDAAPPLPELPAGLPSDLLQRRPDLRQAEALLRAAEANIAAARAAFFPRVTLTGSVGLASSDLEGLVKGGAFAWTVAPQLLQPIFEAGRNQGGFDAARAGREVALAQYERSIQLAFREVADALAGRATIGEQLRAQERQTAAEAARLRLADLRYRNGVASYLEVLDAQRSLFAAQQALLQVRALQRQNGVALYRALGGGWSAASR